MTTPTTKRPLNFKNIPLSIYFEIQISLRIVTEMFNPQLKYPLSFYIGKEMHFDFYDLKKEPITPALTHSPIERIYPPKYPLQFYI